MTALKLSSENRLGAITVDDIAGRAEISRATFYNHFSGVEAVFGSVDKWILDRDAGLIGRIESGVSDPAERMALMMACYFKIALSNPEYIIAAFPKGGFFNGNNLVAAFHRNIDQLPKNTTDLARSPGATILLIIGSILSLSIKQQTGQEENSPDIPRELLETTFIALGWQEEAARALAKRAISRSNEIE